MVTPQRRLIPVHQGDAQGKKAAEVTEGDHATPGYFHGDASEANTKDPAVREVDLLEGTAGYDRVRVDNELARRSKENAPARTAEAIVATRSAYWARASVPSH